MTRPYLLIPKLPGLPSDDWMTMRIFQAKSGTGTTVSYNPLPEVHDPWHPQHIGVLSLKQTERYKSAVPGVLYRGQPAISKIACFGWNAEDEY
jgi:hypothetical protein